MNRKPKVLVSLLFPFLYLIVFFFLFLAYFPKIHEQQTIRLSSDLIYTGFDSYHDEQYLGSYYYQFTASGLQLYFLEERSESGLKSPLRFQGKTVADTKEVTTIKQTLASTTSFSEEDIEELTKNNTYIKQFTLSFQQKLALYMSVLFAIFSIYEIVHAILLLTRRKV